MARVAVFCPACVGSGLAADCRRPLLLLDEQAIERAERAACAYDNGGADAWEGLMVEDHDWYRALVSTVVAALRNEQGQED